ncbi:10572_t:CDS:1 [Acaulospora morrowiae]|uniref:10572_t:CDS:1 n=1 Tax=Acaulospora morrowiae TaxID=94023 RepID=A0A9N9DVE0_9GLOM|nr:10572_t:CDS:1 [Acaulospora morrowiae]
MSTNESIRAVIERAKDILSLRTEEEIFLIGRIVDRLIESPLPKLEDIDIFLKEYDSIRREFDHFEDWDYHTEFDREEQLPTTSNLERLPVIQESPFESETYDHRYDLGDWYNVCEMRIDEHDFEKVDVEKSHVHTFCSECDQNVEVYTNECICDLVPVINYFSSREDREKFFAVNNIQGLCVFCDNGCSDELCICEFTCGLKYVMGFDECGGVLYGMCGWHSKDLKDIDHYCRGEIHRGFDHIDNFR